ncbi:MAG: periplasmic heavy metal sensor [Zetaproteobacteria bacterium]|nr:MAG: periplasmic heavy metal sensor [Zetaproteobacteria bacterium]
MASSMNAGRLWALALGGALALSASAQHALAWEKHGCGHRGPAIHRLAEALHLTDAQREQLKRIHRAAREEMLKLCDAMEDNREALERLDPASPDYLERAKRLAAETGRLVERMIMHQARVRAKVAKILTPEQRKRFNELRPHRRPPMGRRPGTGHDGPPPFLPGEDPRMGG